MKNLFANANFFLFLATLLWGFSGIADKNAVARAHPYTVQWLYALPYLVSMPLWFWLSRQADPASRPSATTIAWAFAASTLTLLGMLCLFFAMRTRSASVAMAITSIYPMVTLLLSVAMGHETFNLPKVLGILLIAGGVFILVLYES